MTSLVSRSTAFCILLLSPFVHATCPANTTTASSTPSTQSLRSLANARCLYFGNVIDTNDYTDQQYVNILKNEHDVITPGNAMKWAYTERSQGVYDFSYSDEAVNFAMDNGLKVRGHTLVWHSQLPSWVENGTWTKANLIAAMQNHITTEVQQYKGKIFHWDVVNEIFNEDGSMRQSVFYNIIGPDYVEMAFNITHAADPDAKLYINDFNIDYTGPKSTGLYNLVKSLLDKGVPVHGIGTQSHLQVGRISSTYQSNLENLASLGVEIAITELDIRMTMPSSPADIQQQQKDYQTIVNACLNIPRCVGVSVWGVTDKKSWIPAFFPGEGAALPWDAIYNPKPAYNGIVAAFGGTPVNITTSAPSTTTSAPSPTIPANAVAVHKGNGLENPWQDWGWMHTSDMFYTGAPTPRIPGNAIKNVLDAGGGASFFGTNMSFVGMKGVAFDLAADTTNLGFRMEAYASENQYQSAEISITTVCNNATISVSAYIPCSFEYASLGSHMWDRFTIMSHSKSQQTVYLSRVYLIPISDQVVPKTTTTTAPATTTATRTSTKTSASASSTASTGEMGAAGKKMDMLGLLGLMGLALVHWGFGAL